MSIRGCVILLLALLVPLGVPTSSAQFGVKGGLSLSGIDSDDYTRLLGYEVGWLQDKDALPQFGLQVGGFYTYALRKHFGIQPEVHLVRRGVDFFHTSLYDTSLRVSIYYVQVPVFVRYRMLLLGPYASIKLASRRSLTIRDETGSKKLPSVSALDYGLILAISPTFRIRSQDVLLELRLEFGLADASDPADDSTARFLGSDQSRILSVSLLTGIRF